MPNLLERDDYSIKKSQIDRIQQHKAMVLKLKSKNAL